MIGKRVYGLDHAQMAAGDYGIWDAGGGWYAKTPNGEPANLTGHSVTEHEDGTITVVPSIAVSTSRGGQKVDLYHGFLERGVWRLA